MIMLMDVFADEKISILKNVLLLAKFKMSFFQFNVEVFI